MVFFMRKGKMSTISKVSFGESSFKNQELFKRHRQRPILDNISQMSDEEIIQASIKNANKQAEQTTAARALQKGPSMFIAATTIMAAALTKGKLSDKTLAAAKTLGVMGTAYALSNPVEKVTGAVLNKKDDEENVKEANPMVELAVNTAALVGATALVIGAAKKGGNKLAKTFAPTANVIKNNLIDGANKLNGSKIGKAAEEISKKTAEFAQKHPKIAEFTRTTGFFAPFIGTMGGSLILANKVAETREKTTVSNVNKLTLLREYAKAAVDKSEEN